MSALKEIADRKLRRKLRVRKKAVANAERLRLSVYRSLNHIYAQIIDDSEGRTLAAASSADKEIVDLIAGKPRIEQSKAVGQLLAKRALSTQVSKVVFDRNTYIYHGRVKALAEGAREGGLDF